MSSTRLAALALLALGPIACSSAPTDAAHSLPAPMSPMPPTTRVLSDDGIFFVDSDDVTRPRIRYLDGQVSQNQSCAIRLDTKLNRKIPPVYVNGQPIGFC